MRRWLITALSPRVMARAVPVSLVVGTLLNLVNQGGDLLSGDLASCEPVQGLLNFAVPYCVATFSATGALLDRRAAAEKAQEEAPLREAA